MKKLLLFILCLFLVGCSSTPTQQWTNIQIQNPPPDPWLMEEPKILSKLPGEENTPVKDSVALATTSENYSICNEAIIKLKQLQKYIKEVVLNENK